MGFKLFLFKSRLTYFYFLFLFLHVMAVARLYLWRYIRDIVPRTSGRSEVALCIVQSA